MSQQQTLELVMGQIPYAINVPFTLSSHVIVFGYAVEESTGAAIARIVLSEGAPSASFPAIPITLAANESVRDWFGPQGLHFRNGITVTVTAGAVDGSVFVVDPMVDWVP